MKIKNICIEDDAYIGGILVRDDGREMEFMAYQTCFPWYEFDHENTNLDITFDEESAIADALSEHIWRRLNSVYESINNELQDVEFDLED